MPVDDDIPMFTDLPCDPGSLGEALAENPTPEGGNRLDSAERCAQIHASTLEDGEETPRELADGVDPHDLAATGWGLITPLGLTETYRELLKPLLDRRSDQGERPLPRRPGLSARPGRSRTFSGEAASSTGLRASWTPTSSPTTFSSSGVRSESPWSCNTSCRSNHAVGRIAFDERTPDGYQDYRRWADAVVRAEEANEARSRNATFLAVEDGGRATRTLYTHLVEPLHQRLGDHIVDWPRDRAWELDIIRGPEADKEAFERVLLGQTDCSLSFVSAHGLYLDPENPYQREMQGALCCHRPEGASIGDRFFHAGDVEPAADGGGRCEGQMAFLFACYGAGTPVEDGFPQHPKTASAPDADAPPSRLAESPFIAALPQALLREGALAVVGHVDRGWTLSFAWTLGGRYTDGVRSLEDSVKQLLGGHRLGHALRPLHRRYTALAAHLTAALDQLRSGREVREVQLAVLWTAHHDARNFVILGDPAVYLNGRPPEPRIEIAEAGLGGLARRIEINDSALVDRILREAAAEGTKPQAWIEQALRAKFRI